MFKIMIPTIVTTLFLLSFQASAIKIPNFSLLTKVAKEAIEPIAEAPAKGLIHSYLNSGRFQEAAFMAHAVKDYGSLRAIEKALAYELKHQGYKSSQRLEVLSSQEVFVVELDSHLFGIFKPDPAHWRSVNMAAADVANSRAEEAAYLLSSRLDWGLVPVTVIRKIGEKLGSVQAYVRQDKLQIDREQIKLMNIFDYLINNRDRNDKNFLGFQGRVVAIDHGLSFISRYNRIGSKAPELSELEMPKDLRPLLLNLKKLNDEYLKKLLENVCDESVIKEVIERRNMLIKHFKL